MKRNPYYGTTLRVTPMRELLDKRPTPTRIYGMRRQPKVMGPGETGAVIRAFVVVEQTEDTYTPASAEKLARAILRAARWARGGRAG